MSKNSNKSISLRLTFLVFVCLLSSSGLVFLTAILLVRLGVKIPPNRLTNYLLICFAISALIGTVLASFLSKRMAKSYIRFKKSLNEVANGNFNVVFDEDEDWFMSQISDDLNATVKQLKGLEIMRSEFITNFSHELKTPITSINGFAELLMSETVTEEERKEYAQIIYNESNRLSKLAKNTLLLSKLEGQTIVTDKTLFSFDEMVENSLILLAKEMENKNLNLVTNLNKINYYWDSNLLSQVVINIVSNSIKYTPEGGEITLSLHAETGYVFLSVKDTGMGMDEKTLSKMFDRYYQGDSSHKTEGNGLGLAIVKKIVDLCGGKIDVGSKKGEGTYILITLPEKVAS